MGITSVVLNFLDTDSLAGKDGAEVDLFRTQTDPATTGDDDDAIMERIVDVGKALRLAGGGSIDLGRTLHGQGLMRTFLVVDLNKVIEFGLLLQKIETGRFGGLSLQD